METRLLLFSRSRCPDRILWIVGVVVVGKVQQSINCDDANFQIIILSPAQHSTKNLTQPSATSMQCRQSAFHERLSPVNQPPAPITTANQHASFSVLTDNDDDHDHHHSHHHPPLPPGNVLCVLLLMGGKDSLRGKFG